MADAHETIRIALERKLLIACPLHPEEMIATGSATDMPTGLSPETAQDIIELLDRTQRLCPRCLDRDDG